AGRPGGVPCARARPVRNERSYRPLMVATRGEDSRRIGRGERARPGKYDKTGRRATSQDGCLTLATIDSGVEPAVELAHRRAQAPTQPTTARASRTSARLAALVSDPEGLDLAVKFGDRVARPEDLHVAVRELGRLSASAPGGVLSPVDRALLGVGASVAR